MVGVAVNEEKFLLRSPLTAYKELSAVGHLLGRVTFDFDQKGLEALVEPCTVKYFCPFVSSCRRFVAASSCQTLPAFRLSNLSYVGLPDIVLCQQRTWFDFTSHVAITYRFLVWGRIASYLIETSNLCVPVEEEVLKPSSKCFDICVLSHPSSSAP
jgi:hypothetical protein